MRDACLLADIIGVAQSSVPSLEEFMNIVGIEDSERTLDISRREAASFCGELTTIVEYDDACVVSMREIVVVTRHSYSSSI